MQRAQVSELLARVVLRTASWLVPASGRADWHDEWLAELWHVTRCAASDAGDDSGPDTGAVTTPLAFIRGAIPDAICLRREAAPAVETEHPPAPRMQPGPFRCINMLTLACVVALALAWGLPGSRRALMPHRYAAASDLVLIAHSGSSHLDEPAIKLADYRTWLLTTRHLYSDLAFYRPQTVRLRLTEQQATDATIVLASPNLFSMLGIDPQPMATVEPGQPGLVVSSRLWKELHGDTVLEAGGQRIPITGVLDDSQWQLPGHADAWLLADDASLKGFSPLTLGYVLAHVRPGAFPSSHRVMIDGDLRYPCLSLAELADKPSLGFLFALFLAVLALPATFPIPLGATARRTRRLRLRLRAWGYLAAKLLLGIPLVYAASLLITYSRLAPESIASPYLHVGSSFFGLLFLFRWAWQDQRSRCPECLGRLTHPARVGLASRSFLAWSGTELVCTSGHGLLHIPEHPTSWFATPRWLALDASWKPLFASSVP